jgi:hypothetical protein
MSARISSGQSGIPDPALAPASSGMSIRSSESGSQSHKLPKVCGVSMRDEQAVAPSTYSSSANRNSALRQYQEGLSCAWCRCCDGRVAMPDMRQPYTANQGFPGAVWGLFETE